MAEKPKNRTVAGAEPAEDFLARIEPAARRDEARRLDAIFRQATGFRPVVWGSILGYGRYRYRYDSGREGESLATGFAMRKAEIVVYIMPGYADFGHLLAQLGPHRLGKSCLYLRHLDGIDAAVLARLIAAGLADLASHWPVLPE